MPQASWPPVVLLVTYSSQNGHHLIITSGLLLPSCILDKCSDTCLISFVLYLHKSALDFLPFLHVFLLRLQLCGDKAGVYGIGIQDNVWKCKPVRTVTRGIFTLVGNVVVALRSSAYSVSAPHDSL